VSPSPETLIAHDPVFEVGVQVPEGARVHEIPDERGIELQPAHDRHAELHAQAELFDVEVVGELRPDVEPVRLGLSRHRSSDQ
jgi:hypothetical protein